VISSGQNKQHLVRREAARSRAGEGTGTRNASFHLVLMCVAALLMIARPSAAQQFSQSFDLVPGWNAIYLFVQPDVTNPALAFAGVPVESVWTRGTEPGVVQFIQNQIEAQLEQRDWLVWVPDTSPSSVATNLVSFQGNRAYFIKISGNSPVVLQVSGRPLRPVINWQANSFNLFAPLVDPTAPPTFDAYFAPSPAHAGQPIYRLLADGQWQQVSAPGADTIRFGEAYWVYCAGASQYAAPLDVSFPTSDGLDFGRIVNRYRLNLRNLGDSTIQAGITDLVSPDSVPLSYRMINTGTGVFEWPEISGTLSLPIAAGALRTLRLAVRRGDISSDEAASVLAVTDGNGTRWLVPVRARTAADTAAATTSGMATVSPFAGLWAGGAVIDKVSDPQHGSMTPQPTTGTGDVCTGGSNASGACQSDADCPGVCSLKCVGGSNDGMACAPESEATDCPDGSCPAPGKRCAGGINVGLACEVSCPGPGACIGECHGGADDGNPCGGGDNCDPPGTCEMRACVGGVNDGDTCFAESDCDPLCFDDDCPGSNCAAMGACAGGSSAGAPCASDGDCPDSTCNTGSRCLGGNNANLPCAAASDCSFPCDMEGGGSSFALRLLVHVDSSGQARLLKEVIQMWQEGTTEPDPDNPGFEREATPGRYVLLTDDTLIPDFSGASVRDGQDVGVRISTAGFSFPEQMLDMTGDFGGSNTLSTTISIAPDFPINPYRHKFHPDHDNLSPLGDPVDEAYAITRDIELAFSATPPLGGPVPEYGFDETGGVYREELTGLHANPIHVEGVFFLQRIVATPELNQ